VALRVADDQVGIEGPVWFAVLNGAAEVLENDVLFGGENFEKGWHVVKGHWFSYVGHVDASDDRRYVQLKDASLFNINSMIRLNGVRFTSTFRRQRKRGQTVAAATSREWVMNADDYLRILESA